MLFVCVFSSFVFLFHLSILFQFKQPNKLVNSFCRRHLNLLLVFIPCGVQLITLVFSDCRVHTNILVFSACGDYIDTPPHFHTLKQQDEPHGFLQSYEVMNLTGCAELAVVNVLKKTGDSSPGEGGWILAWSDRGFLESPAGPRASGGGSSPRSTLHS